MADDQAGTEAKMPSPDVSDAKAVTQPSIPAGTVDSPVLDLEHALSPDPDTEDMFTVQNNKFAFTPGQLSKLLNPKSLAAFYVLGGIDGLEQGLHTDRESGLTIPDGSQRDSDYRKASQGQESTVSKPSSFQDVDFSERQRIFGENRLPEKKSKTLLQLAWAAASDKLLILLTIAGTVSLALGLYKTFDKNQSREDGQPEIKWIEGMAIIVAVVIVVIVTTANDWQMERQFRKLNKRNDDRTVKVVRSGRSAEISVYCVAVGDVLHLFPGDLTPADGILISGHGVRCDESSATGESDLVKKVGGQEAYAVLRDVVQNGGDKERLAKLDPFIISGSKVQEGTGTFLVTAVGRNSSYGRIKLAMASDREHTPLQQKLNRLANGIAWFGIVAASLLFAVLFIKFCVRLPHRTDDAAQKGYDFLEIFIVTVTLIVVAVPEGLPLAVTLALAFATIRMMKDNNLVRVLKACETMGNATTICSDKTGTLTQNKMTVVAATFGKNASFGGTGDVLDGVTADKPANMVPNIPLAELLSTTSDRMKRFLVEANAINSTAFEGEEEGQQVFIGSKTEIALLTFSRDHLGSDAVDDERKKLQVVQVVPFDSTNKYMATVVKLPNGKFRAFVKGAPEILLEKCTKVLTDVPADDADPVTDDLTADDRAMFRYTTDSYASRTLRTISSSYRDFDAWPPENSASEDDPGLADFSKIHESMVLVAIYGIKDPLRPGVIEAIQDCQRAGVYVRMVTGDNIHTARAIASECGIYRPQDGGIAMEGPEFRRKDERELRELVPRLQVLARSSPDDKRILVRTLKGLGETVAVTGDGTNDAPAMKLADVGFAMGIAGTEVAKEAAEIILLDDNFTSIVKGLAWGRAVNDSVRKFLTFQLSVNVTAVVLTFVSAVASEDDESILTAVQLLWVNLIMDTLAALALATDPPNRSLLDRKPDRKSAPLITVRMMKMILGQAFFHLAVTLVLNFAGSKLLGYDALSDGKTRLRTVVFNTFVWLQLFNLLNNRRLDNKLNVFEGITRNYFFIGIFVLNAAVQVLIIFFGDGAFKIQPADGTEWAISVGLGFLSLPCGALIRKFPDSWFAAVLPRRIKGGKPENPESEAEKGCVSPSKSSGGTMPLDVEVHEDLLVAPHPPLRTMSMLRGDRVRSNIRTDIREYLHDSKAKLKDLARRAAGSRDGSRPS